MRTTYTQIYICIGLLIFVCLMTEHLFERHDPQSIWEWLKEKFRQIRWKIVNRRFWR